MYRIVEIYQSQKFVKTGVEPMYMTDTGETVLEMKMKNHSKKTYPNYLEAMIALDKIKKKGVFIITKTN